MIDQKNKLDQFQRTLQNGDDLVSPKEIYDVTVLRNEVSSGVQGRNETEMTMEFRKEFQYAIQYRRYIARRNFDQRLRGPRVERGIDDTSRKFDRFEKEIKRKRVGTEFCEGVRNWETMRMMPLNELPRIRNLDL